MEEEKQVHEQKLEKLVVEVEMVEEKEEVVAVEVVEEDEEDGV